MARILVFDSRASVDTAGNVPKTIMVPFEAVQTMQNGWNAAASQVTAVRTYPVRIHSAKEDITVVDWEIQVAYFFAAATVISLNFFQEFYSDDSSPGAPPSLPDALGNFKNRDWPGVNPSMGWMHELVAVSGGGGAITMTKAVRTVTLNHDDGGGFESVRAPLSVYGLWVRLAMWVDSASSTSLGSNADNHVRVYAHVGGHTERDYLRENGDKPYAYNAYK